MNGFTKSTLSLFVAFSTLLPIGSIHAQTHEQYKDFAALRGRVLNLIGSAKQRIWLSTDYLTDGEIVSALFLAKYRKLDVKVLLDRRKLHAYMSRLRFLKKQSIPVFLKPRNFPMKSPTLLLTDNDLFQINGDLNFLVRNKSFTLRRSRSDERSVFISEFSKAIRKAMQAVAKPVPLVGKARHNSDGSPRKGYSGYRAPRVYRGETDGSYNYDIAPRQHKAPRGVPSKLPQKTIRQKLERKRINDDTITDSSTSDSANDGIGPPSQM